MFLGVSWRPITKITVQNAIKIYKVHFLKVYLEKLLGDVLKM